MKTVNCAILSAFLLLSAALCQSNDEDYADVNCQYQWGGTVCDCENLKYVNFPICLIARDFSLNFLSTIFSSCDCRHYMETSNKFT